MPSLLYLTDLYYQANGRDYASEDLYITSVLKSEFDLLIAHPQQALAFLDVADQVVFRNTGPVLAYKAYFDRFADEVRRRDTRIFNSFDGKADMRGKDYLLQLFEEGYPVIPTVERTEDLPLLGAPGRYVVKLKNGADSIGMQVLGREEVLGMRLEGQLVQPYIDFRYEVSFYYLDNRFQYALFAPDKTRRWALTPFEASADDQAFADRFIQWNAMARGITRVDACRLPDGSLLLVELEDLNPYLSIDVLTEQQRAQFLQNFIEALKR